MTNSDILKLEKKIKKDIGFDNLCHIHQVNDKLNIHVKNPCRNTCIVIICPSGPDNTKRCFNNIMSMYNFSSVFVIFSSDENNLFSTLDSLTKNFGYCFKSISLYAEDNDCELIAKTASSYSKKYNSDQVFNLLVLVRPITHCIGGLIPNRIVDDLKMVHSFTRIFLVTDRNDGCNYLYKSLGEYHKCHGFNLIKVKDKYQYSSSFVFAMEIVHSNSKKIEIK